MATKLSITIRGDKEFLQGLTDLDGRLKTPFTSLTQVRDYYLTEIQKNYNTQGAYFGVPWSPLTATTLKSKEWFRKKGRSGIPAPLVQTGLMKNSFWSSISRNSLVISNTAPYFMRHQSSNSKDRRINVFGRKGQSMTLPRRVMLKLDDARKATILSLFGKWIQDNIKMSFH